MINMKDLKFFIYSPEQLLESGAKQQHVLDRLGFRIVMPVWGSENDPERIWGLTAIILEAVLEKALIPLILNKY